MKKRKRIGAAANKLQMAAELYIYEEIAEKPVFIWVQGQLKRKEKKMKGGGRCVSRGIWKLTGSRIDCILS